MRSARDSWGVSDGRVSIISWCAQRDTPTARPAGLWCLLQHDATASRHPVIDPCAAHRQINLRQQGRQHPSCPRLEGATPYIPARGVSCSGEANGCPKRPAQPEKASTDVYDSYPRAVRETLGPDVHHGTSRSMNKRIEQDHRGITQHYYPMRGFGSFDAAARFCTAHDELRDHLRPRTRFNEAVSLADQRRLFQERWGRYARCRRRPSPPRGLSPPAHRRLPHLCVLTPDASLAAAAGVTFACQLIRRLCALTFLVLSPWTGNAGTGS